ncbi:glutamine-hydrolyzing carbamoyl-phosphate synthase small subunit [Legionella donaldsonii]|uniref:glutamine-hydrolyzing carbamoyl-phosphate synthase small subunit n=1 Tax=Legionella donaldsonii TaxID=45060 RepID=UPI00399D23FC
MAFLILADGTLFQGKAIGAKTHALGEMVFNTSQTGYQEILTDPSYFGQIINFTTPHLGNVGVNQADHESEKIHAAAAVFRDYSPHYSNWRAQDSLENFLLKHHIAALTEIDTRALTLHLREQGSQNGCIVTVDSITPDQALSMLQSAPAMEGSNLATLVSTKKAYLYADPIDALAHIVVIDCGVKTAILKTLATYPIKISVVPDTISFSELTRFSPDGVLLSNGPGDPESCESVIHLASQLLEQQIPIFGICLGHQILALAAGAKTRKMKFGHHGANHPIKCCKTGTVFISSQNHGFVVDEHSLPEHLITTHISLFDGTIAGLAHRNAPAFSFQGHPEANPGPNELMILFQQFFHEVQYAKKH